MLDAEPADWAKLEPQHSLIVTADFLQATNATFGGVVQDPFLGSTQTVSYALAFQCPGTSRPVRADISAVEFCFRWFCPRHCLPKH